MPQRKGSTKISPKKKAVVEKLQKGSKEARALILTDYRGMTVKEITELRRALRKEKGEYTVIKNRLFLRGLSMGRDKFEPFSDGPLALLSTSGDPYTVLKLLFKFVKDTEKPAVKCGILDSAFFEEKELAALSRLPSREVLLAKVAAGFNAPITGFVYGLNSLLQKLVYAISEIQKKKEVTG